MTLRIGPLVFGLAIMAGRDPACDCLIERRRHLRPGLGRPRCNSPCRGVGGQQANVVELVESRVRPRLRLRKAERGHELSGGVTVPGRCPADHVLH